MRDVVVLAIILGSAPICLFVPYYGILVWSWIAYFNPHRFAWGIAYDFPVAQVIAIPTLVGTLFARKLNRAFLVRETIVLLVFWIWCTFTFFYATTVPAFAGHLVEGRERLMLVSKILLMTVLTTLLVTSKKKLKYLFLVAAFSFGLLAVKGAVFGYRTGGEFRVLGPPESFVADNNDFALALNMSLPMLFFLAWDEERRLFRTVLRVAFFCGVVAVILTYSRGGLLGLAVMLAAVTLKSRHKFLAVLFLLLAGVFVLSLAPGKWMDRMEAFLGGNLDESAQQRLITWQFALNFVKDYPITGGGFEAFPDVQLFQYYAPGPLPGNHLSSGPHSIYFQVLGEQGLVGLAIFLILLGSCFFTLHTLRKRLRGQPALQWIVPYSHALEVGLLAFMVSGAFLGRAYFDLSFMLIACTAVLKTLYEREAVLSDQEQEANPLVAGVREPAAL